MTDHDQRVVRVRPNSGACFGREAVIFTPQFCRLCWQRPVAPATKSHLFFGGTRSQRCSLVAARAEAYEGRRRAFKLGLARTGPPFAPGLLEFIDVIAGRCLPGVL